MYKTIPSKPKALALAIMLAGISMPAMAQDDRDVEEIIVTGSLIRGTPEDAALPVEVFTVDDLREVGNPTALEFVKSLTASGPTTGEAYYFGGSGNTSNVGYNLRGIGADKTLSLLNGRRVSENASVYPSSAVARIEILKDGAAVTYGADATGGVVNFITRDDFEGFELSSSYKDIDGSDGDWNISGIAGWQLDDTNLMVAMEWDHRSELDALERSFTSLPYWVNPAPWSTLTNLAGWAARGALPAAGSNGGANAEWGPLSTATVVSDFTQSSCEAVGGTYISSTSCAYGYIPYYNLVEENEFYRVFGQMTTAVNDDMDFYVRAAFARNYSPHQYGSPSQPVVNGPAQTTGLSHQIYVPITNPYVQEFVTRSGFINNAAYANTQGFTPYSYRTFAHGGNDIFAEGSSHSTPNLNDARYWHVSTGLAGNFTLFDRDIGYDAALTYNQSNSINSAPDVIGSRVQEAVMGFGGPNCNAVDLNPNRLGTQNPAAAGTNGCLWYNPFASSWGGQPVLGLDNPSSSTALTNTNDPELIRWLFNERRSENITWSITADLVFTGDTGLELPGGSIAWGAGLQWRDTRFRDSITDPIYNGSQPCAWEGQVAVVPTDPRYTGCLPSEPGPFFFFGINKPDQTQQDQFSYFAEFNLPIFDTLNVTAAARNETFTGDLDATVYKVSGKWDVTENFAFRGSYGTNYQAPGAGIVPGNVANGVNSYTIAAGNWRGAQTITESGIEPETATVWSAGAIWQSRGFADDHDFRVILDYFDIETEDELGLLASANTIAGSVFSISPTGGSVPNNGTALANCSHPLIHRVTFNGGTCTQGVTNANDFSSISTSFGNGPGQHTAGYDLQVDYSFPAFDGEIRLGFTATKVEKFDFTAASLDGFQLNSGDDRLGTMNFATIANAAPEVRANFNANYSRGDHNFRLVANYISGVEDERYINADGSINTAALTPAGRMPGTTSTFGPSYYGVKQDDWLVYDFHYIWNWEWATLSASIVNIADDDPPEARQEMGYDPRIGSPLGRTFEIGLRKTF